MTPPRHLVPATSQPRPPLVAAISQSRPPSATSHPRFTLGSNDPFPPPRTRDFPTTPAPRSRDFPIASPPPPLGSNDPSPPPRTRDFPTTPAPRSRDFPIASAPPCTRDSHWGQMTPSRPLVPATSQPRPPPVAAISQSRPLLRPSHPRFTLGSNDPFPPPRTRDFPTAQSADRHRHHADHPGPRVAGQHPARLPHPHTLPGETDPFGQPVGHCLRSPLPARVQDGQVLQWP